MSSTLLAGNLVRPIIATQRILVATDGSPSSAAAVTMARTLAEASDASVDMVAVYAPPIPLPADGARRGLKQCEAPERGEAATLLQSVRHQRLRLLRGVAQRHRWSLRVEVGDPGGTIARIAADSAPDLVIVGIGQSDPMSRRGTHLPLCLVRYLTAPLFAALGTGQLAMRCIVALPNGRAHAPTIRAAMACVAPTAQVWLVFPDRSSAHGGGDIEAGLARAIVAHACGERLTELPSELQVERVDVTGDMLTGILRVAGNVDADLIAVPNHGAPGAVRMFLPNLAEPLLLSARCSVLVVPDPSERSTPTQ